MYIHNIILHVSEEYIQYKLECTLHINTNKLHKGKQILNFHVLIVYIICTLLHTLHMYIGVYRAMHMYILYTFIHMYINICTVHVRIIYTVH